MAFISETLQMRRLTESGVNIKTTYIVDGTLRYRSTDANLQDDVHSGIRCRKEYFRQGKLLHTEKIFDSRMEYTYVSGMDEEAQHTCENCGFTGKVKELIVDTLTILPIKMPFEQGDIAVDGLTVEHMNSSIPVFCGNYYVLNKQVSQHELEEAQKFLVWLNTSEEGQHYVTEEMAFIPYNADPATTVLGNSLSDCIIGYMSEGNTLTNAYAGAPARWATEVFGLKIMEEYLTKPEWTEQDYEDIANYTIASWKEAKQ